MQYHFFREEDHDILVAEAVGSAVLDTACTRTVCGVKWFYNYMECLNDEDKSRIWKTKSQKFGDGAKVFSHKNVIIPAVIRGISCKIDTEVVDADIPLLLSKDSLKRARTVLDLNNDRATVYIYGALLYRFAKFHPEIWKKM